MLDLYFVESTCSHLPKDPRGLEHAGSVDLDAHRAIAALLDRCAQKGVNLEYFDDSLLSVEEVMTMLEVFTPTPLKLALNTRRSRPSSRCTRS